MVKFPPDVLDDVFLALADPTRRAILERLARGEARVTELAEPFQISLPAVTKHLQMLERAGLIARRKEGRVVTCNLEGEPMKRAVEWLNLYQRFWERQLDSLERYALDPQEGDQEL